MRSVRAAAMVAAIVVVGLLGAGCSQVSSRLNGDADSSPTEAPARPILVTKSWGVVDGMLSVVVRNTTDRTLHTAEGVITARDRNDVLIVSSLEASDGVCCAVADLPPGQEFGFYVDVGDAATEISRVDVAYRDVAWAPAEQAPADQVQTTPLTAHPVRLDGSDLGAVAVAEVRSTEPMVAEASVQAFLNGPDGEFLAVVAGRWFCFSAGSHEIRMQLLHPVPAGTTIDRVTIYPVTGDPGGTALNCAGPAQVG